MQFAQGYARRRKRIYAVKRCGFSHFFVTLGYPFCTNFLQKLIMKKVHLFSCFVILCWFLNNVSLKPTPKIRNTFDSPHRSLTRQELNKNVVFWPLTRQTLFTGKSRNISNDQRDEGLHLTWLTNIFLFQ